MERKKRLAKGLLKVGEIAKKAGILPSTVRYYTEIGLLKPVDYTPGGYRLYKKEETLNRLRKIKEIKDSRPSLREIRDSLIGRAGQSKLKLTTMAKKRESGA